MSYLYTTPLSPFKKKMICAAASVILAALFFIPYEEIRLERIRAFGEKPIVGIVIEKSIRRNEQNNTDSEIYDSLIRYRFIDPSGLPRERVAAVENTFWKKVARGDSVIIHYAKAAPYISRIEHEKESAVIRVLARLSREETD